MSSQSTRSHITGIKVGLTAIAAATLVAVAATGASATPTPRLAAASGTPVTADITVVLFNTASGVRNEVHYTVRDAVVDGSVELDIDSPATEATADPGVPTSDGVNVDIDPDTFAITLQAVGETVEYTDLMVEVILSGGSFGTATVVSDNVWTQITFRPDGPPALGAGLDAQGTFRMSRSVVTALVSPQPTLQSVSANAPRFFASWSGAQPALVTNGTAVFTFATAPGGATPGDAPAPAAGATPVAGTPVFTG